MKKIIFVFTTLLAQSAILQALQIEPKLPKSDLSRPCTLQAAGLQKDKERFFELLLAESPTASSFDGLYVLEGFVQEFQADQYARYCFMTYVDKLTHEILKKKVNLTQKDIRGNQLLHYVVCWGSPIMCQELILLLEAKGISLDPQNKKDETPLHIASSMAEPNCRKLLEHGADANTLALEHNAHISPTLHGPQAYALAIARMEKKCKVTPLWHAIQGKHTQIQELLLEYGADVDEKCDVPNKTILEHMIIDENFPFLGKIIFAPPSSLFGPALTTIQKHLMLLRRRCPQLPPDLRIKLLHLLCPEEVGIHMISRKLNEKNIPASCIGAARQSLYNATIQEWKKRTRDYNRNTAGFHITVAFSDQGIDKRIGEYLIESIETRLKHKKLACNNPKDIRLLCTNGK